MITELNILEQTNILRIKSAFTKEQCKDITEQILAYKALGPINEDREMLHNANTDCWMGQPHFHGGFRPDTQQLLIDTFLKACNEYYKSMPCPANIDTGTYTGLNNNAWEVWAWANVNEPGSENREHTHTGSFMSAVVYFQAEGTGRIEFMPYNYVYKMTHVKWPYYGVSYYEPEDGDILLFPSFLLHKIERNLSNKQRVNMAFNATIPGGHHAGY